MKRIPIYALAVLLIALLFPRCAKVVSPTGGPKDTLAPVMIHSNPSINATNFKGNKLTFTFNEFIQLKDHQQKLLISPPLKFTPIVTQKGKKVVVSISDTLMDNTTYTLYMGNAIEDNNEHNPIPNFEFAFSTGSSIDSMSLGGKVIDAFTNKPIEGALVMLYSENTDSIPYKSVPMHVAKTHKNGTFRVNNLKNIDYKVVTITDQNNDYLYNQGAESIGFMDRPFSKDNLVAQSDTANPKNKILLKAFAEELASQIITGSERASSKSFQIFYSRVPVGSIDINPLNFKTSKQWYLTEPNNNSDTIKYWITDTTIYAFDTLKLAVNYLKTDSLNQLHKSTDTLRLVYSNSTDEEKNDSKASGGLLSGFGARFGANKTNDNETEKPVNPMKFSIKNNEEAKSGIPLTFTLPFPAQKVNPEGILLLNDTDSIMEPTVHIVADKYSKVKYTITRNWEAGKIYKMIVLPNTFITYDCKPIDTLKVMFKGADPENYGTINLKLSGFDNGIVVELLTERNAFVSRIVAKGNSTVSFNYLKAGKYKLRIIDDQNNNGKWDTGNYLKGIQPETVYNYMDSKKKEELTVRTNWETELEFKKPNNK